MAAAGLERLEDACLGREGACLGREDVSAGRHPSPTWVLMVRALRPLLGGPLGLPTAALSPPIRPSRASITSRMWAMTSPSRIAEVAERQRVAAPGQDEADDVLVRVRRSRRVWRLPAPACRFTQALNRIVVDSGPPGDVCSRTPRLTRDAVMAAIWLRLLRTTEVNTRPDRQPYDHHCGPGCDDIVIAADRLGPRPRASASGAPESAGLPLVRPDRGGAPCPCLG
jgi:hypothetical protein